jgi:hypothetical protein
LWAESAANWDEDEDGDDLVDSIDKSSLITTERCKSTIKGKHVTVYLGEASQGEVSIIFLINTRLLNFT